MLNLLKIYSVFILLSLSLNTLADHAIAIIVHPDNHSEFDERLARQIFLGQVKSFPNGKEAQAYSPKDDETLINVFTNKVLRRNPHTMNAYWARMIFTAKATPPRELPDADAVKKVVSSSIHAISYINAEDADDSVRIIAIIE